MKKQQEGVHLQAEERDLRGNQPCQHLDLGLIASRAMRKYISIVQATQSVIFCFVALANGYKVEQTALIKRLDLRVIDSEATSIILLFAG